jgi:FkbM family methyltransferase
MNVKRTVKGLLNRAGYDLRRYREYPHRTRTTIGQSYALLRDLGFRPETVVDVGGASGTPELYGAFPDSDFLLIEPLHAFEPTLVSILERYRGAYVLAAAGPVPGEVAFNVHSNHLGGSSLYKETMGAEADGHEVSVPMVRIDDVLDERSLGGPYLIKIDVQGAELAALDGAQRALLDAEAIVLEVSLFEFMKGGPQLFDVVSYMKDRDFVAYDIVLGWNRPLDNALGQVDIVFVKDQGMFRRDHSYATIEQVKARFG